jgi:N utilization substance protein B
VTSRTAARRTAVELLYQSDVTGADPAGVLEEWRAAGRDVPPFSEELVRGVTEHRPELDREIGAHAEGWTVPRMAAVDRTILRVACYELRHREDVPTAVAIDEAVEAAKALSTEESGSFVNGVLGRLAREG